MTHKVIVFECSSESSQTIRSVRKDILIGFMSNADNYCHQVSQLEQGDYPSCHQTAMHLPPSHFALICGILSYLQPVKYLLLGVAYTILMT